MRIVALLSWFREDPAMLRDMVLSLPIAEVSHLVAVDGAYALFPDPTGHSTSAEVDAITSAAAEAGVGLTLHQPRRPWCGHEIQKRSFMFALAETVTRPVDWYMRIDADERVTAGQGVLATLQRTELDVAEAQLAGKPYATLFRAVRGLHCHANHYTYQVPDGRRLWGAPKDRSLAPRVTVDLQIAHLGRSHGPRDQARRRYYRDRARAGIEDRRITA